MAEDLIRSYMLNEAKKTHCVDCKGYDSVMHESNCWEKCEEFNLFLEDMLAEAQTEPKGV